ncbi:MAG: VWA domain-containing protein [Bacteroidetes bacterium]|nr:VWA domain-containing protein [Bacteroidota bacterium]
MLKNHAITQHYKPNGHSKIVAYKVEKRISLYWYVCMMLMTFSVFLFSQLKAQKAKQVEAFTETRILILFDASKSMIAQWESGSKYDVATKLISQIVDSMQEIPNLQLALHVYGHTKRFPPQDCDDNKLEVPFGYRNGYLIKKRLKELQPSGTTPIALSLESCAADFPNANGRNVIILVTDGIEECNGDPCAVSLALQRKGIVLKPFVIGLGVSKEFAKQFDCVGKYFDAKNEKEFGDAFSIVISQALNNTTAQINLIDAYNKPTETDVAMTFYDMLSGKIKYDVMHTMNSKGFPDTLELDPLVTYHLEVHTIPPVEKDSIKIMPGKHTIIGLDAPQGDLKLKMEDSYEYKNLKCIVRKHKDLHTIHVQDFNSTERYITGNYDLEILTLPRTYINNVNIKQSNTTTIEIPKPGIVTIFNNSTGYGAILQEKNGQIEFVCNIDDNLTKQTITLQPGNYRLVFRPKSSRETIYSVEKEFKVTPGLSTSVQTN